MYLILWYVTKLITICRFNFQLPFQNYKLNVKIITNPKRKVFNVTFILQPIVDYSSFKYVLLFEKLFLKLFSIEIRQLNLDFYTMQMFRQEPEASLMQPMQMLFP